MHDFESVTPELWMANEDVWREKLLRLPDWYKIPLINCNASHNLPDSSLVRFRGMVQDMHNPEFYFEQFEIFNTETNEIKNKTGKYRDTANIMENEKINYTENLKSAQRQTIVVVSIPGLNDWAQQLEDKKNHLGHLEQQPNTSRRLSSSSTKLKRSYDEADEDLDAMDVIEAELIQNKEPRRAENINNTTNIVSREHLLNFPLPDVQSKSCIVKIYDEKDDLKLNDMIEVVGFLSVDPALSGEFQQEKDPLLDPQIESEVESVTHNPPPSLVPRLHAVYVKKLVHCNPLIAENVDRDSLLKDANMAREHLQKALTELLLGDKLAAEYLICHLIACVYLRQDTLTLGQFCLNISNLPTQRYPNYAKQLYDIIQQFVTKSYYLPLTIENLNTLSLLPNLDGACLVCVPTVRDLRVYFDSLSTIISTALRLYLQPAVPANFVSPYDRKDYDCNRLTSGILQLSKDTHLVLDETKMEQGTLDSSGVNNIAAIGNMIKNQKVEYDFKYYKMNFESDIPVLILSEGKSLLPSDYHCPLRPEESSLEIFEAIVEAATYYLKEEIMDLIRKYLTHIKLVKYTICDNLQFVEDDFIEMRSKSDSQNPITADDLHRLLVLARLVSLSHGHDTLNKECWDITKAMEEERSYRLKTRVANNFKI